MNHDGPPHDHVHANADDEDREFRRPVEENLKSKSSWMRVFFVLVFLILYAVSRFVVAVVVFFQICFVLFTGSTQKPLLELGRSLAAYTYELVMYLTFNSDIRPFPFDADWPQNSASAAAGTSRGTGSSAQTPPPDEAPAPDQAAESPAND